MMFIKLSPASSFEETSASGLDIQFPETEQKAHGQVDVHEYKYTNSTINLAKLDHVYYHSKDLVSKNREGKTPGQVFHCV